MTEKRCVPTSHGVEMRTAYGRRRTCGDCGRRWTKIERLDRSCDIIIEENWVEEKHSPMKDNCHG